MVDLSEGTVFIDSESGHLLGAPVVLVEDPGNSCWGPRYFLLDTPVVSVLALLDSGAHEMPG